MLSKSDILEAKDIESEAVEVPEWGGKVMVYGLTAGEKDLYEEGMISEAKGKTVTLADATARLCALCIRDDKGKHVFAMHDITSLSNKSSKALNRVSKVAQRLSGMGKDDIEEIVKNSAKIQNADSD
jgi:hypothetical protein